MRATVMYGAGDVRVENVPDARIVVPTDALVRVTRACNMQSHRERAREEPGVRRRDFRAAGQLDEPHCARHGGHEARQDEHGRNEPIGPA